MSGQTPTQRRAKAVRRPTRIKVLTVTYEVQWLTEDQWYANHLDGDAVGLTSRDGGEILMRTDPTTNEDSLRATLLHEVMHACTQTTRLDKHLDAVDDKEEFFVALVAPILLLVMNDNPNLVAYLLNLGAAK